VVTGAGDASAVRVEPGQLAYAIYTSGSTGRPKAALVEHRGLCNLIAEKIAWLRVDATSRVLKFASPGFDASVVEVFTSLLAGAELQMASRAELWPGPPLEALIQARGVSVAVLPPSALAMIHPEAVPSLRSIIVAGEASSAELAMRWGEQRLL